MKICVNKIKELFQYDPDTGHIYWRTPGFGRPMDRPAGTVCSNGYIGILIEGKRIYAHRIAWAIFNGEWPSMQIDHINLIKTDNRIINLRNVSNSQNGKNLPIYKSNTSGASGVSWDKHNSKWRAVIKVNFRQINIGRFSKFEDAVTTRKAAEEKYFGEFARRV